MHLDFDGRSVYLATGGEPFDAEKPSLLFVHGAGADHTVWVLFDRFLARNGYNALAVDLPGHGLSAGPPLTTIQACAEWLNTLLMDLEIGQCSIIGHSMGSLVALECSAQQPALFNNTVLLGTAAPMPVAETLLDAARANEHTAVDIIITYGHAYASQLGGNPVSGINIVNTCMRILERHLRDVLFTDLNACNEYTAGLQSAARIKTPVSLILGREDRMTPPVNASDLVSALADANVQILENCGHMAMAEQPEATHRALVDALSRSRTT